MSDFSLNEIYTPPNGLPAVDIVFIHGLGDTFEKCWSNATGQSALWPLWLSESYPAAAIWGLQYPTNKLNSIFGGANLSLLTVAASSAQYLRAKKIGKRPVVFICHSLGGIILKAILRNCESSTEESKRLLYENCIGVSFIATPHSGSSIASVMSIVGSKQTQELTRANALLIELYGWYKNKAPASNIATNAFYETKPTKGLVIVDAGSANPGVPNCDCIPIDENHTDICKFDDKEHLGYISIVNFLDELFEKRSINVSEDISVDDLEYYLSSVQGDRLSLEDKLTDGGRVSEIDYATREKERIAKQIRRNALSPSARKKYRYYLSDILTLFRLHVAPLIRSGATELTVNDALLQKVIEPLSKQSTSNELFNLADIHAAVYYLTGNCHIDWKK